MHASEHLCKYFSSEAPSLSIASHPNSCLRMPDDCGVSRLANVEKQKGEARQDKNISGSSSDIVPGRSRTRSPGAGDLT